MDPLSITPESILAQSSAVTASAMGVGMEKKVIDQARIDGANLVELIASSGGIGRNVNTYA